MVASCRKIVAQIILIVLGFSLSSGLATASHCAAGDYDCQLAEIQREIDALTPAHENNKKELANLNSQITSLKNRIVGISAELNNLSTEIVAREEDLAYAQAIFNESVVEDYISKRTQDPLVDVLLSQNISEVFREIFYKQKATDERRKVIDTYFEDLKKLKEDKDSLESSKQSLAATQTKLDGQAKFLGGEIAKVESYITELSSKQQEILAAKSGSFIASVGDSGLADDYYASITGFREAAPGGSFAIFSFGGYTHRKGMSQYGARGRAENGQGFSQILNAYYGKAPVGKDTSGTISVSGFGNLDFENYYLMGIAEMPSSWHPEALKAQAVAARTYAYRYKIEGKTICTSESCQVFNNGKAANPPAAWKAAVEATRGQVLEDVVTYYSSTAGGYLTTMGWDTTDGGGGNDFIDKAWEARGGSPWLYKAWYRQGYSASGATCGRSNPWLSGTELADIVNAALVLRNRDDDRITPVTTDCWGGNPYSHDELRNAAAPYGGIASAGSAYVTQGNGVSTTVVVNGISLSGDEFKQAFNLRAPGYLRIPQSGFAFFNIEHK